MKSKSMDISSKDLISSLPEALISHILSFLPIEDSALTSVLSKKWRYLFAFTPNLYIACSENLNHASCNGELSHPQFVRSSSWPFRYFLDRVLRLQGNSTINKFSLKCGFGLYPDDVKDWILNLLERGVSDLHLRVSLDEGRLPSNVFVSKSLINLRIESKNAYGIDVENVYLSKLKILYLHNVMLGKADDCFNKLTSGCHVLEELALYYVYSDIWNRSLSSKTLKRVTLWCIDNDKNPDTVSFNTPNLVYLKYSDYVAVKYPEVNLGSLVEASIDLAMTSDQSSNASYEYLVGNAKDFLMGLCNVQVLDISGSTLEVLTFCCESIPVFKNLVHLTITTHQNAGWESLPTLLKNCPNLETLVFQGLYHRYTIKCGSVDGCLCKYSGEIPTCLSSSPVKVLKITKFGEIGVENQIEMVKLFLETMPHLEQVIIYYDTSINDDLVQVSSQLEKIPRVASPNCVIQVISNKLS